MKNYILMLGVAGVFISSYAAYADNEATMNVTATIAHETNIRNVRDIEIGTITIDPSYDRGSAFENDCQWMNVSNSIESISGSPCGYFTANFASGFTCGAVFEVTPNAVDWNNMHFDFGVSGTDTADQCKVWVEFSYDGIPAVDDFETELLISYAQE
ncbi:MAG: hypothetical protein IJ689_02415 [Alphaproteobacteria bacterium]|nr:hypothetical protein [Alphaproteobacteria bacterium]